MGKILNQFIIDIFNVKNWTGNFTILVLSLHVKDRRANFFLFYVHMEHTLKKHLSSLDNP